MSSPLDFAIQLAQKAGELLMRPAEQASAARLKADKSVVTEADLAADRLIAGEIRAEYPGDMILSEELEPRLSGEPSEHLWVIDPLDGTTNYSLGLPFWGVSIARLKDGIPELGVLYFPPLDELYSARCGQGASFNGSLLVAERSARNHPASFFACCSRTFRYYDVRIRYKPRILGSAAYSICSVARGIALIAFEATPKVWDLAGAWLVVKEAGAAIETYDDTQLFPVREGVDYSRASFPTLAASTPELLIEARNNIIPKRR